MIVSSHSSQKMLWTLFIQFVIVSSAIRHHRAQPPHKCTPKDERKDLYSKCMQGENLVLWCDYTNYTSVPDPDTVYTDKSCRNSIALYLNNSCITSLSKSEMAKYPNIEDFQCGKNFIKTLTREVFSGNGKLKTLNLCINSISDIKSGAFKGLNKLEIINLTDNSLTKINSQMFYGLTSLKIISFERNQIHVIRGTTFTFLHKLEVLFLTGNQISHIDENAFSGLGNLQRLHLDGNELSRLSRNAFAKMPMLKVLTLSYNKFSAMPAFEKNSLSILHTLNLGHNMLESFEISNVANLSKLQNLSLENNSLHIIPDGLFHNMPNLRFLNLSSNGIEELSECTFSKSCNLDVLSLSDNRLKIPHAEWFSSVIRNGIAKGTNISGNSWNCECETIPFNNFLSTIDEEWREVLDITCHWPKRHKGKRVSEVAFTLKDSPMCYGFTSKGYVSPCNVTAEDYFVRQTEVYTYQPTIQTEETTEPKVLLSVESFIHSDDDAGYEVESLKSDGSSSSLLIVLIVCIGIAAFVVLVVLPTVMLYVRKRDSSKTKGEINRNSFSSSAGLLSKPISGSDSYGPNYEHSPKDVFEEDVFSPNPSSITSSSSNETSSKDTFQITREKTAKGKYRSRTSTNSDSGCTANSSPSVHSDLINQTMSNQPLLSQIIEADVNVSCTSSGESNYLENCHLAPHCGTIPKILYGDPSLDVKSTVSGDFSTPSQLPVRQDPIGGNTEDHLF